MSEIENPVWLKYAGDIFFLVVFLVIFFFVKPIEEKHDEENSLEEPNELEKMLKTDSDDDQPDPEENSKN